MKQKILVTGGAGYIGSVLVGELLQKGYEVCVLDRLMFGGESLLSFWNHSKFSFVYGDIRDKKILRKAMKGVTDIIHLASFVGPACNINPTVTKEVNEDATRLIVEMSKQHDIQRFIFASSASNYGISRSNEVATEESPLKPLSLYSETKVIGETIVQKLTDNGICPTVVRFAMIFGISPRIRFNLMVNEFAREAALGSVIAVRNPRAWRPFLHAYDASSALIAILEAPIKKVKAEVFNVTSENIQKGKLANLAKRLNPKIKIEIEETGKDDLRDYKISSKKIKQTLGWKPTYTIQNGLSEVFYAIKVGLFRDPYGKKWNAWLDDTVIQNTYELHK